MIFPPSFLDEIRARTTLSELVGKRVRLVRSGRAFKACCPFHKEKTPSFHINDDRQSFHCFGCGAHGDAISFMMRHDNLSFPEAVESLAAQAGLVLPKDTPIERERFDQEKRLLHVLERATLFFEAQIREPGGREAYAYLRNRGLSDEAMRRFRLGYAPIDSKTLIRALGVEGITLEDMETVGLVKKAEERQDFYAFFRNRVMFPVGDKRGRIVAFGGRVMGEGEPKYLNSPESVLFHKGALLYGLSRARAAFAQGQPLIVVEGYMDVIALVEAGFIGSLAPLGTALTETQLESLWRLAPLPDARDGSKDYSPILCFDGDGAGVRAGGRAIARALPLLTAANTIRIAYLPQGEDPDSLLRKSGRGAMQAVLDKALPMIDALWTNAQEGRLLRTPEQKSAFRRELRVTIDQIKDQDVRRLYADEMDKRFSALFQWRKNDAKWTPKKGGRPGFYAPPPHPSNLQQPLDGQRLRERVLLALMVNHPALFADFAEDLARITFSDKALDALREEILAVLDDGAHETLDAAALYRHLSVWASEGVGRADVADLVNEGTYVHAGFARPGRSLAQARQGGKSIWNKYLQEQLQADIHVAGRLWREDPSDENLRRLMTLREQVETLARESLEQDMEEGEESFT